MSVPETIRCVECGGTAHLLTGFPPDEPPLAGDIVPYRCAECGQRFDVELDEQDVVED